eukprot:TRINITY_DN54465_c0_g1_i1.p1 TRINITY_DN54465_c0_g1~~TRINITY_DN54465_c0_g1_i1.p1  ORF type:complete len:428 (-),score=106.91 TRINITY_DN54465_c0_g1_i1:47-1330(-)
MASNVHVRRSDDGRGQGTEAVRDLAEGEVIFQERPLALVYPSRDAPWLADLRRELRALSEACAWQYCMAVHCLTAKELPEPCPDGIEALAETASQQLEELCGAEDLEGAEEPSELAVLTAERLVKAAEEKASTASVQWPSACQVVLKEAAATAPECRRLVCRWLAARLDEIAVRVSRNGFQVMDLAARPPTAADALFHRVSFFNHCCAGLNNASWNWSGSDGLNTVRTTRAVAAGEELTISYIAKPWCDLAKPARRRYLKQNFNFVCLCQACTLPSSAPQQPTKIASKAEGKLESLLLRWMTEGSEVAGSDAGEEPKRAQEQPESRKAPTQKAALSDEERLERLLQKCKAEGLAARRCDAEDALRAEEGHVGKAMIRLRRLQRSQAETPTMPPAPDGSSALEHCSVTIAIAFGMAAAAALLVAKSRR